ncbi:TolC family protein [Parasphingorhabdus sp.]|jgi:cobalt-zinc-cadmium efflux system outer membrane protein|uniref:TolC family protein n=1 Tax=Parasphingorhabdus sp. TaxID=2709688 RepID=UPI0039E49BC5
MLRYSRAALLAGALLVTGAPSLAETVSLNQAVAKALDAAPLLRAEEAAIAAARAGKVQADVRPNPSVTVEAENFVGTGRYSVLRRAEVTATYNQPIERGGKRAARVALAEREIGVASASAEVTRLELAAAVQRSFLDILIARQIEAIAKQQLSIEEGLQSEALRRVRGYKDPLFVETRAAARVAQAQIAVEQSQAQLRNARDALASFWGGNGDDLDVVGELVLGGNQKIELAEADQALEEARVARASAAVIVEQTRKTQDYTVNGGTRFIKGTNDIALVAGITIPLGRFDRNQGNIERARAERWRLELTAEANRLERLRRRASLGAEADRALSRAEAIKSEVYPRVAKTLAQVREGYNRGGFSFRDMQDAADAIIIAQDKWLTAMIEYRDLQTELDRLTGRFDASIAAINEGYTQP